MQQSPVQPRAEGRDLTIGDVATYLRSQWKFMFLIWSLIMVITVVITCLQSPQFDSNASLYFQSASSASEASMLGTIMDAYSSGTDIETDKELFKSASLMDRVLLRHGLNSTITGEEDYLPWTPNFFDWWMHQNVRKFEQGLRIEQIEFLSPLMNDRKFELRFQADNRYTIHPFQGGQYINIAAVESVVDERVVLGGLSFVVTYVGDPIPDGTVFEASIKPLQDVRGNWLKHLSVEGGGVPVMRKNILQVTYRAPSPQIAQKVVDGLTSGYLELRQNWASSNSRNIIAFIENNVKELQSQLDESSEKLARFQEESGLMAIEPQLAAHVEKMIEADQKLQETDVRLMQLRQLQVALDGDVPEPSLLAFLDDPVVLQLSNKLTQINAEIAEMSTEFRENARPLQQKREARQNILDSLDEIVDEYVIRAEEVRKHAEKVSERFRESFRDLPSAARALAEYRRSQALVEELYTMLIREKQQAELAEANTLSDIRVVDQPSLPLEESSPRPIRNGIVGFGAGIFFAVLCALMRVMTIRTVQSADEIKRELPDVPVFGHLPQAFRRKVQRASTEILDVPRNGAFMEAVRQLRVNIQNAVAGKSCNVIFLTSPMPGDGKSLVTSNLAVAIARSQQLNKGVLLIDGDIIRPSQDGIFDRPRSPGLTDYLNGRTTFEDIVQHVTMEENVELDVICSGAHTPTPVELLEMPKLRELIDRCRDLYDYILIDCAPYPLQTSALVVAPLADRVLAVVRPKSTNRHAMVRCVTDLMSVNEHTGLIINGIGSEDTYGTYKRTYGYTDQNFAEFEEPLKRNGTHEPKKPDLAASRQTDTAASEQEIEHDIRSR